MKKLIVLFCVFYSFSTTYASEVTAWFENESNQLIEDLKKTFVFKENQFAGVFVYNYESEATSTEIKMTATV